jgi:prepilin-type N-terminal cleavage/methylation domain-containing protein
MKTMRAGNRRRSGGKPAARAEHGFSLLELTIAMVIFVAVSSIAFSLFNQQQKSSKILQGQTALNVALRNAAAELQMDLASAGSGYFPAMNMPSWPVGVTIVNNMNTSGTACNNAANQTYGVACFDQINILTAATPNANSASCVPGSCYPVIYATGTNANGNCSYTYVSGLGSATAYGQAAVVNGTTWTLAQTAAEFQSGNQLLFLNNAGTKFTTVVLTANPTVSSSNNAVQFTFNSTNSDGSTNSAANDPLDIAFCDGWYLSNAGSCANNNKLTDQFCSTDYIIKLSAVTYQVCAGPGSPSPCDQTSNSPDITDPKLVRIQNGVMNVVMEQVIGFRVGAALINGGTGTELQVGDSVTTSYNYVAKTYTDGGSSYASPWNFSLVRSVRVSLIGRTAPSNTDNEFQNAFDQGHYQVQGIAIVVNPRNMSMNDN